MFKRTAAVAAALVMVAGLSACTAEMKEEDKALMTQAVQAANNANASAARAESAADRAEAAAARAEAAAMKTERMFQKGMRK